jgi:hypothetical protein
MLVPKSMKRVFNEAVNDAMKSFTYTVKDPFMGFSTYAGGDGKDLMHIFEIAMSLAFLRFVEAIV